jgi:NAD(P)-dependent dehydrogenase (short-subunit alcohol dehydrogenase family)
MPDLHERVAVVTGTSRGIGRAIAAAFARSGARVAGCSRGVGQGSFLDELTAGEKARCLHGVCDVRAVADVYRFRDQVEAALGPASVLVNNAGTVARQSTAALDEATWTEILASNLTSTYVVTRAFLPSLKTTGGRIINLSSIAGRRGTSMLSAYCAAKHGVVGLTRSWAEEFRSDGVAVNAICPGSVDTDMLREGMPGAVPAMTAEDVARVALFLASDAPSALTGACIDVFG